MGGDIKWAKRKHGSSHKLPKIMDLSSKSAQANQFQFLISLTTYKRAGTCCLANLAKYFKFDSYDKNMLKSKKHKIITITKIAF